MKRLALLMLLLCCSVASGQALVHRSGGGWIEGEAFWYQGNQLQTQQFAGHSPATLNAPAAIGHGVVIAPSMQIIGNRLAMWQDVQIVQPYKNSLQDIIDAMQPRMSSPPLPPIPNVGATLTIYAEFDESDAVAKGITTPLIVEAICISSSRRRGQNVPKALNSNYADSSGSMSLRFDDVQYVDSFDVENSFRLMFLPRAPQHCVGTVNGVTTHYLASLQGVQTVTLSCWGDPVYYPYYFTGQVAIELEWKFTVH